MIGDGFERQREFEGWQTANRVMVKCPCFIVHRFGKGSLVIGIIMAGVALRREWKRPAGEDATPVG
jgi:hypothetical protein